jgi:hypothetical protein
VKRLVSINNGAEEHPKLSGRRRRQRQKVSYTPAKVMARDYAGYCSNDLSPDDLASQRARAGRKPDEIPDWAHAIILAGLKPYLDDREPEAIRCYRIILGELIEENKRRAAVDLFHKPFSLKRSKFYVIVGEMKPSEKQAYRLGAAELRRTMATGLPQTRVLVYGEVIQIDEYEMPLWIFLRRPAPHGRRYQDHGPASQGGRKHDDCKGMAAGSEGRCHR